MDEIIIRVPVFGAPFAAAQFVFIFYISMLFVRFVLRVVSFILSLLPF